MRAFALLFLFLILPIHAQDWETWKGCKLIPNQYNDGDSFHVAYQGEEYIVRLYFVDTPETDKSNRGADSQVAAQAAHFGKSEDEVMHIGSYAKQATAQMLSRPFTVLTRGTDARGNSAIGRIYGFVKTADGKDLGEELVRNGLARSHGTKVSLPHKSASQIRANYDSLGERARRSKVGIYSPNPTRSIALDKGQQPVAEPIKTVAKTEDKVDFEVSIPPPPQFNFQFQEPGVSRSTSPAPKPQTAKTNINTASKSELEKLPGIGPTLAERIIAGRPYTTISDLKKISGIGAGRFEELREHCTVN